MPQFEPENPENAGVIYTSSNDDVASVNAKGQVKANKGGQAIITCQADDGYGAIAVCEVTVVQPVKTLLSPVKIIYVIAGQEKNWNVHILPKDATNTQLEYRCADQEIATIDRNGNVKGLSAGEAVITAIASYGDKKVSVTCKVCVEPNQPIILSDLRKDANQPGRIALTASNMCKQSKITRMDFDVTWYKQYDGDRILRNWEHCSAESFLWAVTSGSKHSSKDITMDIEGIDQAYRLVIRLHRIWFADSNNPNCTYYEYPHDKRPEIEWFAY